MFARVHADLTHSGFSCLQGWLLGNWLGGLKDKKATVKQVLGYLEDGIIVPELGMHRHSYAFTPP